MSEETLHGVMRCSACRGMLAPSGQEPYRFICDCCGQNFFVTLRVDPVAPLRRAALPEPEDVGGSA